MGWSGIWGDNVGYVAPSLLLFGSTGWAKCNLSITLRIQNHSLQSWMKYYVQFNDLDAVTSLFLSIGYFEFLKDALADFPSSKLKANQTNSLIDCIPHSSTSCVTSDSWWIWCWGEDWSLLNFNVKLATIGWHRRCWWANTTYRQKLYAARQDCGQGCKYFLWWKNL